MTRGTPSPPPDRGARRPSFSGQGRDIIATTEPGQNDHNNVSRERELSPWSARRALTERLRQGNTPREERPRSARNASDGDPHPPPRRRRSPPPRKPADVSSKAVSAARGRDASPDPCRRTSREHSKDVKRRDRSRERRDRSRARERDAARDRRTRDRSGDRRRYRSRDRSRDKHRDRSRPRSRDKNRDRSRDTRRSRSPPPYRSRKHRSPSSATSPPPKRRRRRTRSPSRSHSPHQRSRKPLPDQEISFRGLDNSTLPPSKYGGAPKNLEKPNFKPTGLLAKAANKVEGTKISLKYHEPPEARKPSSSSQWRLFVFKGDDVVENIELYTRSCWLLGRAREVADILLEHSSSSGQHAVIQFRYIQKTVEDEYGVKQKKGKVKPYIIDLESSNGTELNGEKIEGSRYFELRDKDILKFAASEREYVVMLPPPE